MKNPVFALNASFYSLLFGHSPRRSNRRRGFQPRHQVEVCETRELLAADFSVQFGQIFAGHADNQIAVDLTNAPSNGGLLNAWVDFDGDGRFHSANEKVFSDLAVAQGVNVLYMEVPFSAVAANQIARFSVSTTDPDQRAVDTTIGISTWLSEPVVGPRSSLSGVFGPSDIVSADFDNDGDIDVFTANITGARVSYYENNGNAQFVDLLTAPGLTGSLQTLEPADLNNDGLLDIVAGTTSTSALNIFMQTSPGMFTLSTANTLSGSSHVEIADFNNDGSLDILTAGEAITLLINDGSGAFTASTIDTTNGSPGGLAAGDIDGDGDIDAVASGTFEIVLYRNDGTGGFTVVDDFITPTEILNRLRVFDMDQDGRMDIVGGRFIFGQTFWFENSGASFIEHSTNIPGGRADLKLGDINGDGFIDVLTAEILDGADIYVNSGDNLTFNHINIHDNLSESIDAVDIDGDGDLDFVTEDVNNIVWFRNDSVAASPVGMTLPTSALENAGILTGSVLRPANSGNSEDLIVSLQSSDLSVVTVPATVTIPAGTNSAPLSVTILDDTVTDGDHTVTITAMAPGASANSVMLTIIDNESPGISVAASGGSTSPSENGTTDSFGVTLAAQPQNPVTITVQSTDTSQVTVDTTTLIFTNANWNLSQPVTVTAVDDAIADGTVPVSITLHVDTANSDSAYQNISDTQYSVSVLDNEVAGIVSNVSTAVVSETGSTTIAEITLSAEPTGNVAILVSSSDTTEATTSPLSLFFTPGNWNTAQSVSITGVDDNKVDGNSNVQVTLAINKDLTNPVFDNSPAVVIEVTNSDNDTAGLSLSKTQVTVVEGGATSTFDAVLTAAPVTNVVLNVASSDETAAGSLTTQLTFTPANWNQPQTVTVIAFDDSVADGNQTSQMIVTVNAALSDDAFDSVVGGSVEVTTVNNDTVGFTTSLSTVSVSEADDVGSPVGVQLTAKPANDVVLNVAVSDEGEIAAEPTILTFTTLNWNIPQSVSIRAVNDSFVDGDQMSSVTLSIDADASDDTFDSVEARMISVVTVDDDVAGISLDRHSALLSEDGNSVNVNVMLTASPAADTVITVSSSNEGEVTASVSELTFNAANWNVPQTVTLVGVDEQLLDGTTVSLVTFSVDSAVTDAAFVDVPDQSVMVTVEDNDVAAIVLSKQTATVSESGSVDFFEVMLNVTPTNPVTVKATRRTSGEVIESPSVMVFTSANWNVPQRVTLTGVDDAVVDGDQVTVVDVGVVPAVTDDAFDSLSNQSVVVTTVDNDAVNLRPTVLGPVGRVSDGRPVISWQSVTGAVSYQLWLEDLDGDGRPVLNPTISGTSYGVPQALPIGRYRAWVLANFGDGTRSGWAAQQFSVTTAPQVVTPEFHATNRTPTINWSTVPGAVQYQVYISNVTEEVTVYDAVVTDTEFTVPNDLQFGRHAVWVRAIGAADLRSEWSLKTDLYVGPGLIGPTGSAFDNTPTFQWTAMDGIGSYQVLVQRNGVVVLDVPGTSGDLITGTSYTPDASLLDGDYRWWIRPSAASGGLGAWSPAGEFNIGGRTKITSATANRTADTTLIKWNAVSEATQYEVFIGNRNGLVHRMTGITAAQYIVPTPLADGDYQVWVRSFGANDRISIWSRPLTFNVHAATAVVVATPKAAIVPTFERPAALQWTTTENAVSVDIVYESEGTVVRHNAVTGNALTLPVSLTSGHVQWWVRANSVAGIGSWSRQSVVELDPQPFVAVSVDQTGRTSISWTPVTGAVRYILQVNTAGTDSVVLRQDNLLASRLDVSLLGVGNYRAWVLAIGADGQRSRWSNPVDFVIG